MDESLKYIDQLCQIMLKDPIIQLELDRHKELSFIRQSQEPLSVSDIILILSCASEREKLIQYQIQSGLFYAILDFCLNTPVIFEEDNQLNQIFLPLWAILEQLLKFRELIKNLLPQNISKSLIFSSTALDWWTVPTTNLKENNIMIKKLLKIISRLSINEKYSLELISKPEVYRFQDMMKLHFDDSEMIMLCLQVLIELAYHKSLRALIIHQDYLGIISNIYTIYADNINILYYSADLTYHLILDQSSNYKRVDVMSILTCQIQGLKKFRLNDSLIERNLNSIAAIIHHNQSYQSIFMKSNSLDLLLQFVQDYVESPKISAAFCLLVNSLTYKNMPIKETLGRKGFVQVLINILTQFTTYENYFFPTLKNALKAIGNISLQEENSQTTIIMEFIRISNQLISGRKIIEDPLELQFFCDLSLDIIYTIYNPETYSQLFIEQTLNQGIVDFMLQCIKLNKKNKNVVQKAVDTLGPFLAYDYGIQQFSEGGGFGIICNLIQLVNFDFDLVLSCFQILVQVLSNDQDKLDLIMSYKINLDMVNTIKQITLQKVYTPTTQQLFEEIIFIAHKLSYDSVKCRIIWNSQFIETSFELLHESRFNNKTLILNFLRILLIYSQMQEASVIIAEHGSKIILQIISDNLNSSDVIEYATNLIQNLIEIQSNLDILSELTLNQIGLGTIHTYIQTQISKSVKTQRLSFLQITTKDAKDYLLKGVICKLIKENGDSSELVLFLSHDLQVIQCKQSSHKITKQKWRMKIDTVDSITANYQEDKTLFINSAFSRTSSLFKKKPDPARCLSIKGRGVLKAQGEVLILSFNVCAPTILDKNKMVEYLKLVIQQFTSKIL